MIAQAQNLHLCYHSRSMAATAEIGESSDPGHLTPQMVRQKEGAYSWSIGINRLPLAQLACHCYMSIRPCQRHSLRVCSHDGVNYSADLKLHDAEKKWWHVHAVFRRGFWNVVMDFASVLTRINPFLGCLTWNLCGFCVKEVTSRTVDFPFNWIRANSSSKSVVWTYPNRDYLSIYHWRAVMLWYTCIRRSHCNVP